MSPLQFSTVSRDRSGSNTLVHLVTRYPGIKVVCLDKVNYCASVKNFDEVKNKANFVFVLVRPFTLTSSCLSTYSSSHTIAHYFRVRMCG